MKFYQFCTVKMNPNAVMITGANRGIGLELVKQLLNLMEPPSQIFAVCRTPEKAQVYVFCHLYTTTYLRACVRVTL